MAKSRTCQLTTHELHALDAACGLVRRAFGHPPYLVGSAGFSAASPDGTYRDVDVRLILDDDEFEAACPTQERWELLCLGIGAFLRERTGLPVDFQVQQMTAANSKHDKPRNPLGMSRAFAGGGDATPAHWGPDVHAPDKP